MVLVPDVSQANELGDELELLHEQPVPVTEQEIPLWLPDEPDELLEEPLWVESEHAAMVAMAATLTRAVMKCFTMSTLRARRDILHGHSFDALYSYRSYRSLP